MGGSGYPTLPPCLKTNRPGSVTVRTGVVTGECRNGSNDEIILDWEEKKNKMPTSIRITVTTSEVVSAEGPMGPKCTKSVGALIGLSAWSGRMSAGALNTSTGALRKSTGTLDTSTGALEGEWGALEEG